MKKIMIAYCQYGGGHLSAAKNIKEYIEQNYPDTEILLFDFMKYISKIVDKVCGSTYSKIITNIPWLWGKIYYHTQEPVFEKIISLSNKVFAYKLLKLIKDFKPDVIISTHFFVGHMCSMLKKKGKLTCNLANVITDYGVDPYNEWISGHKFIDYIFVPHSEMKSKLIEKGVLPEKLFATGIPISNRFLCKFNKKEILESLNFSEDKKTILFFGGGEQGLGKSKTIFILEVLASKYKDIQIIAVAGKNENLKNTFDKIVSDNHREADIKVLGFTDKVPEFMHISDIVITKPGGLTSTESLVSNLPLIAINPIPGQETDNAEFLEKKGAAIWLKDEKDFIYVLNTLLRNDIHLQKMKENIEEIRKPDSTQNICKIILEQ